MTRNRLTKPASFISRLPSFEAGNQTSPIIHPAKMSSQAYYELYRGSRYCISTRIAFPSQDVRWFQLSTSIGLSLTDTLDDLINEGRIEPQLAMKILSNFDRVITEVLADKVRARLSFKVLFFSSGPGRG